MGRTSDAREKLMKAVIELIWIGSYGSTTIDQICERAGVKKGSFYYFFESKAALAGVALQEEWELYRARLDQWFSPSLPALERIHRYCEAEYEEQVKLRKAYGFALGCPLCTLGCEISTLEPDLRRKIDEIMAQARRYFETTVRDAVAEGAITTVNTEQRAKTIYAFVEGLLAQARIQDNVEILKEMEPGIREILGVRTDASKAA